jgi:hypothetical protein
MIMSDTFHLRWAHEDQLPPKGKNGKPSTYNVRPVVAGATPVVLEIDSTAVEILCSVCGESLREPQRQALLPTLRDVVSNTTQQQRGTGSLSQAGELCAILGLAQFALRAPEPWLFVRIPEASVPQPDIFALTPGGKPWYVELKGVAKLEPQVKTGAAMQTCGNIVSQIGKGRKQLTETSLSEPDEYAPEAAIQAAAGAPSFAEKAGGLALSVVILADAALLNRTDIQAAGAAGCPPGKSCMEECLSSPASPPETSIVGLLWTEEVKAAAPATQHDLQTLNATLVALKALDAAAWAGSRVGTAESLSYLAGRLANRKLDASPADAAAVLGAALRVSRGLTTAGARNAAVFQVINSLLAREAGEEFARRDVIAGLFAEAAAGGAEGDEDAIPLEDAFRREEGDRPFQVVMERIEGGGLAVCGTMSGRTLRLAPRLSELRHWLEARTEGEREDERLLSRSGDGGELLQRAAAVVTRTLLPRMGIREFEIESRESRPVGVRLGGERLWVVGREWTWGRRDAESMDHLPHDLQEQFASVAAWSLQHMDPMELLYWGHSYREELGYACGMSRCDVRLALDDIFKQEMTSSASRLTQTMNVIAAMRKLFSGPPSRRRLWAAMDGTILAEW